MDGLSNNFLFNMLRLYTDLIHLSKYSFCHTKFKNSLLQQSRLGLSFCSLLLFQSCCFEIC